MKTYDKLTLEKAVKESHNFSELCRNVGMVPSTHTKNILRRNIQNYGLNINHFDSHFSAKQRRIYPVVKKTCPVCGTEFISKLGSKREKKYCSSLCCNVVNIYGRLFYAAMTRMNIGAGFYPVVREHIDGLSPSGCTNL
jgi:hypothetical protein